MLDTLYIPQLHQRRQDLLSRMTKWRTPLVSQLRYDTHVTTADTIVRRLREGETSTTSLVWLSPQTFPDTIAPFPQPEDDYDDNDNTEEAGRESDLDSLYTDAEVVDTEEVLLGDFISETVSDEEGKKV